MVNGNPSSRRVSLTQPLGHRFAITALRCLWFAAALFCRAFQSQPLHIGVGADLALYVAPLEYLRDTQRQSHERQRPYTAYDYDPKQSDKIKITRVCISRRKVIYL